MYPWENKKRKKLLMCVRERESEDEVVKHEREWMVGRGREIEKEKER